MIEHSLEARYLSRPVRQRVGGPCATKPLLGAVAIFGLLAAAGCSGPDKDAEPDTEAKPLEPDTSAMMMETVPTTTSTAEAMPMPVPGGDAPNGLSLPEDVLDWRVLGVVDRPGDNPPQIRVVVGNDIAVDAARSGDNLPWPDGSMIADLAWAVGSNDTQPDNVVPGNFALLALMVKDSEKYAADRGWAYGIWRTAALNAPTADDFDRACVTCHVANAAGSDFVFTAPGLLPAQSTVQLSGPSPNSGAIVVPPDILDWRVVGVVNIPATPPAQPTIRVIVGNDVAVEAARKGETDPWPEYASLAHFQWNAVEAPQTFAAGMVPGATVPGAFRAITVMTKNSTRFEADGDWAYANWGTTSLTPPAAGGDRVCVDCHTDSVSDRDMVFTDPAALPALLTR